MTPPLICTYFEPIEGYRKVDHADLVKLWVNTWESLGFETKVLKLSDAVSHPHYETLLTTVRKFPTINPKPYEEACFVRWCATANAAGPDKIIFMDYDVFPTAVWEGWPAQCFFAEFGQIPSCVAGRRKDFDKIINTFLKVTQDHGHVSDMTILFERKEMFDTHWPWLSCFGAPDWEDKPLVHFANWTMSQAIPSRAEFVRQALLL